MLIKLVSQALLYFCTAWCSAEIMGDGDSFPNFGFYGLVTLSIILSNSYIIYVYFITFVSFIAVAQWLRWYTVRQTLVCS